MYGLQAVQDRQAIVSLIAFGNPELQELPKKTDSHSENEPTVVVRTVGGGMDAVALFCTVQYALYTVACVKNHVIHQLHHVYDISVG